MKEKLHTDVFSIGFFRAVFLVFVEDLGEVLVFFQMPMWVIFVIIVNGFFILILVSAWDFFPLMFVATVEFTFFILFDLKQNFAIDWFG